MGFYEDECIKAGSCTWCVNGLCNDRQCNGGGWFEVGVGTNINLSDTSHLYFDLEKTYGGDTATPWQWNAGVRFSF